MVSSTTTSLSHWAQAISVVVACKGLANLRLAFTVARRLRATTQLSSDGRPHAGQKHAATHEMVGRHSNAPIAGVHVSGLQYGMVELSI